MLEIWAEQWRTETSFTFLYGICMGCISKALLRGTHYLHVITILELQRAEHQITAKWHKAPEILQHILTSISWRNAKRHCRPLWNHYSCCRWMQLHAVTLPAISDAPPNNRGAFPCRRRGWIVPSDLFSAFNIAGGGYGMHANKLYVSPCMLWHTTWRAKLTHPLTPRVNNRNDNARNLCPKKRISSKFNTSGP